MLHAYLAKKNTHDQAAVTHHGFVNMMKTKKLIFFFLIVSYTLKKSFFGFVFTAMALSILFWVSPKTYKYKVLKGYSTFFGNSLILQHSQS